MENQTAAEIQRDINGHKGAQIARLIWGNSYANSGLGLMGFWDTLTKGDKKTCRRCLKDIENARPEAKGGE